MYWSYMFRMFLAITLGFFYYFGKITFTEFARTAICVAAISGVFGVFNELQVLSKLKMKTINDTLKDLWLVTCFVVGSMLYALKAQDHKIVLSSVFVTIIAFFYFCEIDVSFNKNDESKI